MSLVTVTDAEWRTRKINLFRLLRGFLSQIQIGQDLTKVSLPSELCHPFSMLEMFGYRLLAHFSTLFELDDKTDFLERMLIVLKWYMTIIRNETLEKKPYNPVLGETHMCWVQHAPDDLIQFVSEQVSHHPPMLACIIQNKKRGYSLESQTSFGVKFGANYLMVSTSGQLVVHTGKEEYYISKLPDLKINNTITGSKYIIWEGTVTISCKESGYNATLTVKEDKNRINAVQGMITHQSDALKPIYNFSGVCGKQTHFWAPQEKKTKKLLLLDFMALKEAAISYLPPELTSNMDSVKVWEKVNQAIINNDLTTADDEKKKLEAEQRIMQAQKKSEGTMNEGTFFTKVESDQGEGFWKFKHDLDIVKLLSPKQQSTPNSHLDKHQPSGPQAKKQDF